MLSSNSSCSYNPFPENDTNSCNISKLEDNPYCSPFLFTNFPNSPHMNLEYEDFYHQFLDLFSQQQQQQQQQQSVPITTHNTMPNEEITKQPIPSILIQKRLPKKDRHSKINTARGPRDRRMRLSLDVARKFFDLQDMLGFDKASRTVDWLLSNSMSAIRELGRAHHVGGSDSDSSTNYNDESSNNSNEPSNNSTIVVEAPNCTKLLKRTKKKKMKIARPSHVARESRRKARERARERTSQKRRLESEPVTLLLELTKHGSSNDVVPIYDLGENEVGDHSLVYTTPWNPSTLFHQNQISEFQIWGKPWEAYKGLDLSG